MIRRSRGTSELTSIFLCCALMASGFIRAGRARAAGFHGTCFGAISRRSFVESPKTRLADQGRATFALYLDKDRHAWETHVAACYFSRPKEKLEPLKAGTLRIKQCWHYPKTATIASFPLRKILTRLPRPA